MTLLGRHVEKGNMPWFEGRGRVSTETGDHAASTCLELQQESVSAPRLVEVWPLCPAVSPFSPHRAGRAWDTRGSPGLQDSISATDALLARIRCRAAAEPFVTSHSSAASSRNGLAKQPRMPPGHHPRERAADMTTSHRNRSEQPRDTHLSPTRTCLHCSPRIRRQIIGSLKPMASAWERSAWPASFGATVSPLPSQATGFFGQPFVDLVFLGQDGPSLTTMVHHGQAVV
jgi:hypothetical protein